MSIEKMTLINLYGDRAKLEEVILKCSEYKTFYPQPAVTYSDKIKGFAPLNEENPYADLLKRIIEIAGVTGLTLDYGKDHDHDLNPKTANQFLDRFQQKLIESNAQRDIFVETIRGHYKALEHLTHIEGLDISLDDIFSTKFLEVRFGRLPVDNFQKLGYYSDHLFIYISLDDDGSYNWGVYVTTEDEAPKIDHIFASLNFERIQIPNYITGIPNFARVNLQAQINTEEAGLAALNTDLASLVEANRAEFCHIFSCAKFLDKFFDMRKFVLVTGNMLHITGFVPSKEVRQFMNLFSGIENLTVKPVPVDADSHLIPPTRLKNNAFVKPFEIFTEMFGLPDYNSTDPTPLVALILYLIFGIMLGDMGLGLVLALAGALLWKWKGMRLGQVMSRLGFNLLLFWLFIRLCLWRQNTSHRFFHWRIRTGGHPARALCKSQSLLYVGA